MASQIIPVPEQQRISQSISRLTEEASFIAKEGVRTATEYAQAGDVLARIKGAEKTAQGILKPYVDIAKRAWEEAKRTMDVQVSPFAQIKEMVSRPMEEYAAEERRKAKAEEDRINEERRREAQRKADEERREAEKRAAEERKEREKELEKQRKAGELSKREAERLTKEAREQEERDRKAAAEQVEYKVANLPPVEVKASIPTVAGVRRLVLHKFHIIDASKLPRAYLVPDILKIGQLARSLKGEFWKAAAEAECPGVEFYEEDSV
jgi:hypothetical protein